MSRNANRCLAALSLLAALAFFAQPLMAATAVVTLDAGTVPPAVVCGQTWVEADVTLSFVSTTSDDCTLGACFFGIGGFDPNGVDLYPARLNLDLTGLNGEILSAEADILDGCGVGCTRAFFYEGGTLVDNVANTMVGNPETLVVTAGANAVDRMAVSSCEGGVLEIRIEYDPLLPIEPATWGAIKAEFE